MNTRQGILVTLTGTTIFLNFAATYWQMWTVASISFGTLLITDMMFFDVCDAPALLLPLNPSFRSPRPPLQCAHQVCLSPTPIIARRRTTSSGPEQGYGSGNE